MSIAKRTSFLASAWFGALLLWAPQSSASQTYPQAVADTLAMSCVPTCLLCHDNMQGGLQRTSPFGQMLKDAGLMSLNPASVGPFLTGIETTTNPDTDGDMMQDIAELRAGRDPNEFGEGTVCGGGPTYGCGARVARERTIESGAFGMASVVALALALMRRRRRPVPSSHRESFSSSLPARKSSQENKTVERY